MLDRRVETFLKLCETMSYRAAAEQLHITQPAVTQHIHALEQHYGCELFRYDGRSLSRTRSAELLERTFRAMLSLSNNYVDGVRLRLAGRTMAALNPHFFYGYYAL